MRKSTRKSVRELTTRTRGKIKLRGVYRGYLGKRKGLAIWVVDSEKVCSLLYPPFLMGGNDQRYRFNPAGEVWIEYQMSVEELETTIAHELLERNLMRDCGWSYGRAHDFGYAKDQRIRALNAKRVARRLQSLRQDPEYGPEVAEKLNGIYRGFYRKLQGVNIWFVDGPKVRQMLNYDFGFPGGYDLGCTHIPRGEIWLDGGTPIGQLKIALTQLFAERDARLRGVSSSEAFTIGLEAREAERERQLKKCLRHEAALPPVSYGCREKGAKEETNTASACTLFGRMRLNRWTYD